MVGVFEALLIYDVKSKRQDNSLSFIKFAKENIEDGIKICYRIPNMKTKKGSGSITEEKELKFEYMVVVYFFLLF